MRHGNQLSWRQIPVPFHGVSNELEIDSLFGVIHRNVLPSSSAYLEGSTGNSSSAKGLKLAVYDGHNRPELPRFKCEVHQRCGMKNKVIRVGKEKNFVQG